MLNCPLTMRALDDLVCHFFLNIYNTISYFHKIIPGSVFFNRFPVNKIFGAGIFIFGSPGNFSAKHIFHKNWF